MKILDIVSRTGRKVLDKQLEEKARIKAMRDKKEQLKAEAKKKLEEKKKRKKEKKLQAQIEAERQEMLKEEGMDLFFRTDSYVPAHPDEYEGHYPGNQNNAVVMPYKRQGFSSKRPRVKDMQDKKGWD